MSTDHARFAHDDVAYVAGALAPADAAAFQAHLRECLSCQANVEQVQSAVGGFSVLSELSAIYLTEQDSPEPVPSTVANRLMREVVLDRRRRTLRGAMLGVVAACLLIAISFGAVQLLSSHGQPAALTLQPISVSSGQTVPVNAVVTLTATTGGTEVHLKCGYVMPTSWYGTPPTYQLAITNRGGASTVLGSWTPENGEDVELIRRAPWPKEQIGSIEIQTTTGTAVLRLSL